jgi:hypothetical protein
VATAAFRLSRKGEARAVLNLLTLMRKTSILLIGALVLASCSPRDMLSRRLATDLIAASDSFKTPQQYVLQTGILSNKDYASPEYLVLQHHGWISATTVACTPGLAPPPCWDIVLTPSGVETVRTLLASDQTGKSSFSIPVARRELVEVVGISKQGGVADVEFIWRWVPLNEIGAVLYSSELRYKSTVGFRNYDDGWRVVQSAIHSGQTLEEALRNAEPGS